MKKILFFALSAAFTLALGITVLVPVVKAKDEIYIYTSTCSYYDNSFYENQHGVEVEINVISDSKYSIKSGKVMLYIAMVHDEWGAQVVRPNEIHDVQIDDGGYGRIFLKDEHPNLIFSDANWVVYIQNKDVKLHNEADIAVSVILLVLGAASAATAVTLGIMTAANKKKVALNLTE